MKRNAKSKQPATLDAEGKVLQPIPPVRLHTIDDCRLEMARVYRLVKARQLGSQDASRMVFILAQIGRLIETGQLEQRIKELERRLLP